MSERLPTDELRAEHDVALGQINELVEAAAGVRNRESRAWEEVGRGLRERVEELGGALLLHFRKEEEGLFTDVVAMVSKDAPRVDILAHFFEEEADDDLKAHTLLRGRLKELTALLDKAEKARKLEAEEAARFDLLANLARDLLERHAKKEHELVFPMIERLLDDEQMRAAWTRIREISGSA